VASTESRSLAAIRVVTKEEGLTDAGKKRIDETYLILKVGGVWGKIMPRSSRVS